MEEPKKGFQIEFCSEEDTGYTSIGLTFAMLGSTFSTIEGFPFVVTMIFFLLGIALPCYDFCTKVADQTAPGVQEENATDR
ncbi:MAG: hypothetical protein KTR30_14240 [Saprospiraceae bacterium]|nr:hypothetical protein [Saprospiraceae bacterium]